MTACRGKPSGYYKSHRQLLYCALFTLPYLGPESFHAGPNSFYFDIGGTCSLICNSGRPGEVFSGGHFTFNGSRLT